MTCIDISAVARLNWTFPNSPKTKLNLSLNNLLYLHPYEVPAHLCSSSLLLTSSLSPSLFFFFRLHPIHP